MSPPWRQSMISFISPKCKPFLGLTVKFHHHLFPTVQVFNKGVWFGSWCFTDPSKLTFKTFIVFHVIVGEIFFVVLWTNKCIFLPNSWWIKIHSMRNLFLASACVVLLFSLFTCCCCSDPLSSTYFLQAVPPFFSTINGKLLGFIFKGTINTACIVITHAEFALSFSSLFPWYLLHCLWPQERCSLMNSRQIPILFLFHARIIRSMNPYPSFGFFSSMFPPPPTHAHTYTSTAVRLQLAEQCHNSLPSLCLLGTGLAPSTVNPPHQL